MGCGGEWCCGVGIRKQLSVAPKTLILVEWVDACIDLDQEGQPADFKADNTQIAKTPGWFIKTERGKLFMGLDLWDQDPAKPIRSCHQIPLVDVVNVWSIGPGSLVYSTAKAASSSPKPTQPRAGGGQEKSNSGSKSQWRTKRRSP